MANNYGAGNSFTSQELGFPAPPTPPPGNMPPGNGRYAVPQFLSFPAIINSVARTFPWTSDEALRDNRFNALAMRRDPVLIGALRGRQIPTAMLSWHLEPRDETDPAEVESAQLVTEVIEAIPRFQTMKMLLLEAVWFGKYAVELAYQWETWRGRQVLTVRDFQPLMGDKLRIRWDGQVGVLVYAAYPGEKTATDWGLAHFLTPEERQQFLVHHHEPEDVDYTEVQLSGGVNGVGIRGRIYWLWWLKQQVFGLLMNYLERFANGFTIIYYAAHDPAAKTQAEGIAHAEYTQNAILIPRWSSERPDLNKVERIEVGTASPALLQNLVTEYFDDVMVRFILGQTHSSMAEATGIGAGSSELHGETLDSIVKYDAVNLQETIQTDLVNVLYRYNAPGVRPGKFSFQVDTPNAGEVLGNAQLLYQMGVGLDEEELLEMAQLSKPRPGSGVVSQIAALQQAATVAPPMGTPVSGQPTGPAQDTGSPMAFNRTRKAALPRRCLVHA